MWRSVRGRKIELLRSWFAENVHLFGLKTGIIRASLTNGANINGSEHLATICADKSVPGAQDWQHSLQGDWNLQPS